MLRMFNRTTLKVIGSCYARISARCLLPHFRRNDDYMGLTMGYNVTDQGFYRLLGRNGEQTCIYLR